MATQSSGSIPSMTKGPPWRECRGVSAATIMPARVSPAAS